MSSRKKKSLIQNSKNEEIQFDRNSAKLGYLTFLNFGALKNIIFKLKNNIVIVSAGRIYSIKSELKREGILAKIKCK